MSTPSLPEPNATAWARAQLEPWRIVATLDDDPWPDRVGDWAKSGAVALTGRADGPPLVPPGAAATAARGAEVAFSALTGRLEGLLRPRATPSWPSLLSERAAAMGLHRQAPWSPGGTCRAVATLDGWLVVNLARPDDARAVPALVDADAPVPDAAAAWDLLVEHATGTTTAALVERARLLALPCGAVPPEGAWRSRVPFADGTPSAPVAVVDVADGPKRTRPPLVIDLSALWAGPLCAHLLGAARAQVVKVELAARLDGARRGNRDVYDVLHAGHDSVVVDPEVADDRALLDRLLTRADVVIEASRPRALQSLGIDAEEVCRRTPTTWVSITAYGRTEPDLVGFGDDVAMAAGLVAREDDGVPVPCGDAIADPLAGMHAALAALASHRIGGSRILDVAMADVAAATLAWAPTSTLVARRARGGWVVDGATGRARVAEPRPRAPQAPAAPPGRDTERWRQA